MLEALVVTCLLILAVLAFGALRRLIRHEIALQLLERRHQEELEAERQIMRQPMSPIRGLRDPLAELRRRSN